MNIESYLTIEDYVASRKPPIYNIGFVTSVDKDACRCSVLVDDSTPVGTHTLEALPIVMPIAGSFKTWALPHVGDRVLVLVDANDSDAGLVLGGVYSDGDDKPEVEEEEILFEANNFKLSIRAKKEGEEQNRLKFTVGENISISIIPDENKVLIKNGNNVVELLENGVNVGNAEGEMLPLALATKVNEIFSQLLNNPITIPPQGTVTTLSQLLVGYQAQPVDTTAIKGN